MLAFLLFFFLATGQAVCEDQQCNGDQLNLLQLRDGHKTDELRLEPDSDDVGVAVHLSEVTPGAGKRAEVRRARFRLSPRRFLQRNHFLACIKIDYTIVLYHSTLRFFKPRFQLHLFESKLSPQFCSEH